MQADYIQLQRIQTWLIPSPLFFISLFSSRITFRLEASSTPGTSRLSKTSPTTCTTWMKTPRNTWRFYELKNSICQCTRNTLTETIKAGSRSCIITTRLWPSVNSVGGCGTWTLTEKPFQTLWNGMAEGTAWNRKIYTDAGYACMHMGHRVFACVVEVGFIEMND